MTRAQAPLDSSSCWLCLEEGPDTSGKPLVRNCSCRGSSGYAHISCLVHFAESKSKKAFQSGDWEEEEESLVSFIVCSNCKQEYQNDLVYDLSKAQLQYVEREFASHQALCLYALTCRINQLHVEDESDRYEGEAIVPKMLSIVDEINHIMVHTGCSVQYTDEGHAYANIASFYRRIGSDDSLRKATFYFQKAKRVFEIERNELIVLTINNLIEDIEAKISGGEHRVPVPVDVELESKRYELFTKEFGAGDTSTIESGVKLALAMWREGRNVESVEPKRMLEKLIETSRLVHGPEHATTIHAISALEQVQSG